jgi:hypothetical protein
MRGGPSSRADALADAGRATRVLRGESDRLPSQTFLPLLDAHQEFGLAAALGHDPEAPTASLARRQWTRSTKRSRTKRSRRHPVHDPDYHDPDDHRGHDLARDHDALGLGTGELRLDCAVDVAVDVVGSDEVDDSVGFEHGAHLWLQPGEA